MKDRLLKILTHFGYTATKFADEIGVQRSGISHILSGRNQPGYDFIVKALNKFPDIDAEWFILGKGTMIKSSKPETASPVSAVKPSHFPDAIQPDLFSRPQEVNSSQTVKQDDSGKVTNVTFLKHVILLNSDGTFDQYNPTKKD